MTKRLLLTGAVWVGCLLAQASGDFAGNWTSKLSGNAGKLNISVTENSLSSATFSFQGSEVQSKPISLKKTAAGIVFVFEYSLDGNVLRTTMEGSATPTGMAGKYKSATPDGATAVDEGTWEVTQKK